MKRETLKDPREKKLQWQGQDNSIQLNLCSMVDLITKKSFKLWGKLQGRLVLVFMDCGASRNFMSQKVAEELHLSVLETPKYWEDVGDGWRVAEGVVRAEKFFSLGRGRLGFGHGLA